MTYSDCSGYIIQVSDSIALRGCQPNGGAPINSSILVESYTGSVLLRDQDGGVGGVNSIGTDGTFSAWNQVNASSNLITNSSIHVQGLGDVKIQNLSLYAKQSILVGDLIIIASSNGDVRLEFALYTDLGNIAARSIAIAGKNSVSCDSGLIAGNSIQVSDAITITSSNGGVTLEDDGLRARNGNIAAGSIVIAGRSDVSLNYSLQAGLSIQVSDAITITSSDGGVTLDNQALLALQDIAARSIAIAGRSDVSLANTSLFAALGTLQVSDIRLTSTHGAIRLGRVSDYTDSDSLFFNNSFYAGSDGSRVGQVTFVAEELNLRAGPGMSGIYNDGGVITIDFSGVKSFTGLDYENFFQVSGYEQTSDDGGPGLHPNNLTDRLTLLLPSDMPSSIRTNLLKSACAHYKLTESSLCLSVTPAPSDIAPPPAIPPAPPVVRPARLPNLILLLLLLGLFWLLLILLLDEQ